MMWSRYSRALGFLLAMLVSCSPDQRNDNDAIADKNGGLEAKTERRLGDFLVDAIETEYAEIKLAELASTKSNSRQLIEFAQELANDHTNTLTALQALAEKNGLATPREEGNRGQELVNKLAKEQDTDFDMRWCREIKSTHKERIRDFEAILKRTKDQQLEEVINQSLDLTKARLRELEKLEHNLTKS
jgi:putative membrane protein